MSDDDSVLFAQLRGLDYSGTVAEIFARIDADTLAGLLDEINGSKKLIAYFALRLRSAADGYPREMKPIAAIEELPHITKIFERTVYLITMEHMRRKGDIEILDLPARIDDDATPFKIRATEAGRKRFEQLKAMESAESANGAEGVKQK